jgi:CxxC motif-containing protein
MATTCPKGCQYSVAEYVDSIRYLSLVISFSNAENVRSDE